MLQAGGNAVDAALAAAAALTVVEPIMNGIGGDMYAIVWDGHALHGLNATGAAPAAWRRERFDRYESMPMKGWDSVTVPGQVAGWSALSQRFGTKPLAQLFEPAVAYAERGFPVSPFVGRVWSELAALLQDRPGFANTFLPQGRAPVAGETFRAPGHARSLSEIAETRGDSFYRGALAERIVAFSDTTGGCLTLADLDAYRAQWQVPLARTYRRELVLELPDIDCAHSRIGSASMRSLNYRHHPQGARLSR